MRDRHCRTDWLCDIRGTPVLIVRRGCLSPDDAEMFAAEIGRAMKAERSTDLAPPSASETTQED